MSTYARPDTALRKAKDYLKVAKPEMALQCLHRILSSRRHRTWTPTHEKIMFLYVAEAVKLRKNTRDVFVLYRMVCQNINWASMASVIEFFRKSVEERAEQARVEAEKAGEGEAIIDLEETPESIMLKAVSGEDTKDRQDRKILTPWLKYMWESYRTILETLKTNGKLQSVYQETARRAFRFCLNYKRQTEFRRLADILRSHRTTIQKYSHQQNGVDLSSPETKALYRETRFLQLKTASKLELWQEAYRTIEDIHEDGFDMQISGSEKFMIIYFERLSQIFWASGNHLFHAYTLEKYYSLGVNAFTPSQKRLMASAVVLAVLSIPSKEKTAAADVFDPENEGNLRLASMLGFKNEIPNRQRLLDGIRESKLIDEAEPFVKKVHDLLEKSFAPLTLTSQLEIMFKEIEALKKTEIADKEESAKEEEKAKIAEDQKESDASESTTEKNESESVDLILPNPEDVDLTRYVMPVKKLALLRLLQQLSTVFKSLRLEKFYSLVPSGMDQHMVERFVMRSVRGGLLSVRLDHQAKILQFVDRNIESDHMKHQLRNLAVSLRAVVKVIQPVDEKAQADQRQGVFQAVLDGVKREHELVFWRREEIEKRKREKEDAEKRAAEERKRLEEEAAAKKKKEEEERLAKEKEKRKKLKEEEDRKKEEAKKKEISEREAAIDQQRAEKEKRLAFARKKVDYLCRALRYEEQKVLEDHIQNEAVERVERLEKKFKETVENKKARWERMSSEKKRLGRMKPDVDTLKEKLNSKQEEKVRQQRAQLDEKLQEVGAERDQISEEFKKAEEQLDSITDEINKIRQQIDDKKAEIMAAKNAAEERRREQERIEEEKKRAEEEAAAAKKAEEDKARRDKLEAIRLKQLAREKEIEERQAKKREEMSGGNLRGRPSRFGDRGDREGGSRFGDRERGSRFGDREGGSRFGDQEGGGDKWRSGRSMRDRDSTTGGMGSGRRDIGDEERGSRVWRSERRDRGEHSERTFGRSERNERSFDRNDRSERSERPERVFNRSMMRSNARNNERTETKNDGGDGEKTTSRVWRSSRVSKPPADKNDDDDDGFTAASSNRKQKRSTRNSRFQRPT